MLLLIIIFPTNWRSSENHSVIVSATQQYKTEDLSFPTFSKIPRCGSSQLDTCTIIRKVEKLESNAV